MKSLKKKVMAVVLASAGLLGLSIAPTSQAFWIWHSHHVHYVNGKRVVVNRTSWSNGHGYHTHVHRWVHRW